jgi:uncharacterized SAM-binding protein YcdF (DUF218 family)
MFFYLSKLLEFIGTPVNFSLFVGALGAALLFTRRARAGSLLCAGALLVLLLLGFSPLATLLAIPLEARFPAPPANAPAPTGIIVLGGAVSEEVSVARHSVALSDAAERVVAPILLKRLYPSARLVFTGGAGTVLGSNHTESEAVAQFWREAGVDPGDVVYEDRSRNTHENAVFTRDLVKPQPGERWLLVTSAMHMPRSIGIFRKAGFPVVAYPVDYRTSGDPLKSLSRSAATNFSVAEAALHEWAGLLVYWLTGRSDALFPAP